MSEEEKKKILNEIKNLNVDSQFKKNVDDLCNENSINLSYKDKIEVLMELTRGDIFTNIHFIGNSIIPLASDDDHFVNLIFVVYEKIKNDLVQGPLTNSLISIGEKNPSLGIQIAKKIINKNNDFVFLAGYLLGGSGRTLPSETWNILDDLIKSNNSKSRMGVILAIRIMYAGKQIDEKIVDLLIQSSSDPDNDVQYQVLEAFFDFYEKEPSKFNEHIFKLVNLNERLKITLANRLWIKPLSNSHDMIKMLEFLYASKTPGTMEPIFYALTRLVDKYPDEIMAIVQNDLKNGGSPFGTLGYLLQELGKVNLEKSLEIVGKWINLQDQLLNFHIPRVVVELFHQQDRTKLIPFIEKWLQAYSNEIDLILKIHNHVLSNEFKSTTDEKFLTQSFKLLSDLAKQNGLKSDLLVRNEDNLVLKCSILIHAIQYYSKDLNFEVIFDNLNHFQFIAKLLDQDWLERMESEKNRTHLLLRILERKFPSPEKLDKIIHEISMSKDEKEKLWHEYRYETVLYDLLFLLNLDFNLKKLEKNGYDIISHFKKKIKNEEQVAATLSEINFIAPFSDQFKIQIDPQIINKKADVLLEIDSEKVYVEIISPDMFKPLELLEGVMQGTPNRIKGKILSEYKDQLFELSKSDYPVILVVDTSRSEIHPEEIEDALFGAIQYTFLMDSKTGESKGGYSSRQDNSIHQSEPGTSTISAVICFKPQLHNDLQFHNVGVIIPNPKGDHPIDGHLEKRIKETLFT